MSAPNQPHASATLATLQNQLVLDFPGSQAKVETQEVPGVAEQTGQTLGTGFSGGGVRADAGAKNEGIQRIMLCPLTRNYFATNLIMMSHLAMLPKRGQVLK